MAAAVPDPRDRFDLAAAAWWLEQCRVVGEPQPKTAEELVQEHRTHLHPLDRILAALEPDFELGLPVRGPWLYRWKLGESLRAVEEEAIARGDLRATGARLVARRRPHELSDPEIVTDPHRQHVPALGRLFLRLLRVSDFIDFRAAS